MRANLSNKYDFDNTIFIFLGNNKLHFNAFSWF